MTLTPERKKDIERDIAGERATYGEVGWADTAQELLDEIDGLTSTIMVMAALIEADQEVKP